MVTKPKTTTVISDQNGRSTRTSTERPVMNASCSKTARTRSADMPVASGDLQKHVFQGWLANVDIQHVDPGFADVVDRAGDLRLLSGDDHRTAVIANRHVGEVRAQRTDHGIGLAVEPDVYASAASNAAGQPGRGVLGDDAPAVQKNHLIADAGNFVHLVAGVDNRQVPRCAERF